MGMYVGGGMMMGRGWRKRARVSMMRK